MSRVVVTGKIPKPGLDILRRAGHEVDAWEVEDTQPRESLLAQVQIVHAEV